MFNLSLLRPASLALQAGPSPIIPPIPDFGICDRRYGSNLTPLLCGRAADTLTQGDSLVPYTVHSGDPGPQPQTLPYTVLFGRLQSCFDLSPVLTAVGQGIARFGSK